jgi:hypothetical protein
LPHGARGLTHAQNLEANPTHPKGTSNLNEILIPGVRVIGLRFPTSRDLIGSDAVSHDPDSSAAYCSLQTSSVLAAQGLSFTLGRGADLVALALEYLAEMDPMPILSASDIHSIHLKLKGGGDAGLCEYVQHLSFSPALDNRVSAFVDHLHEHLPDPAASRNGHDQLPAAPAYRIQIKPESLTRFACPHGEAWATSLN